MVSTTFSRIFDVVSYKLILCLTGTLERLDGKEEIIKKYAPVCDKITVDEAEQNG
jgi:superfamily II DNA or RNA helicase